METAIGSIWGTFGALLFVGFLGWAIVAKDASLTRIAAAGGLWALLGSLSVTARYRQSGLREQQSAASKAV